jgi:hypothetical protein
MRGGSSDFPVLISFKRERDSPRKYWHFPDKIQYFPYSPKHGISRKLSTNLSFRFLWRGCFSPGRSWRRGLGP